MTKTTCIAHRALASAGIATALESAQDKALVAAPETRPRVMVLHPLDDHLADLLGILGRCGYRVEWWSDLTETMALLRNTVLPLVICASELADGTWRDLLRRVSVMASPPLVVVSVPRPDDRLWVEVLNWGGYDVLVKPFDADEVVRVVKPALEWWHEHRARRRPISQRQAFDEGCLSGPMHRI